MLGVWGRTHKSIIASFDQGAVKSFCSQGSGSIGQKLLAMAGTLDNRLALCKALQISYHRCTTDENLIVQAYARWSDRCCEYLLGSYSFVVWDSRSSKLFCARDPVGSVPFYYSLTSDHFVFGTSIKAVLSAEPVSDELDERFVRTRLENDRYIDSERTFYKAVRKLPPGHTLSVTPDSVQIQRYWFPESLPKRSFSSDDECASAFIELLTTVVEEQLPSKAKVGAHLTGGLDSSTVAAVASRVLRGRGHNLASAYCWLPPPLDKPLSAEHNLIEQVRGQLSIKQHFQKVAATDTTYGLAQDLTLLPAAEMLFQERPVMQQAQKDGIQVLLSGWGGDELISFNGRGYYANLFRSRQWRRLWKESQDTSNEPIKHIFHQGIASQYPLVMQAYKSVKRRRKHKLIKHYLNPDFLRQVKPYEQKPLRYLNTRQTQLDLLANGHLAERMEAWAEMGKRYGFIYRYPLLDKRIVEFALCLPPEMFRRGKWNRWIMRTAAAKLLPADVAWNPDKRDPVRMAPLKAALKESFIQIGKQLSERTVNPSRAQYLDMPRLLSDLNADSLANQTSDLGKISHALLFLDF